MAAECKFVDLVADLGRQAQERRMIFVVSHTIWNVRSEGQVVKCNHQNLQLLTHFFELYLVVCLERLLGLLEHTSMYC